MSKKLTPTGIGLDLAGDAIEGGLAGAGAALGGAASGIGALAGGLAQGAGAALGGALEGALREPDVYISSYGVTGAYAKSNIKTTARINLPNGPQRVEATEDMPLEKLMSIAIKYLSSISKTLRSQSIAENKASEQERLANKESVIENTIPTAPVDINSGDSNPRKKMSNMTKALLGLGGLGLGALALNKIDLSELEDLGKNISHFKEQYGWMLELAGVVTLSAWFLRIPGLGKLIYSASRAASVAAAEAIVSGASAVGGAIVIGSGVAFGGAAGVSIAAPAVMDNMAKSGGKKALTVKDHLSKYGIEVKTKSVGGIAVNTYFKDGKLAKGKDLEIAQAYGSSIAGIRGASSIEELDKKYSSNAKQSVSMSGGDIKAGVYQAFINAGFSPQGALSLSAEVGRENSFNPTLIFGSHIDPHNGKGNAGIFSYQGSRKTQLFKYLNSAGVIQNGQIEKSQRSLNAMAKFARMEMDQRGDKANGMSLSQFLSQPNVNQEDAARALGKNYIAWRFDDPNYASGHKNRKEAYTAVAKSVGVNGNYEYSSDQSSPITEVKEMVAAGYNDLLEYIKTIGKTDTQFKPLTSKAGTWDKSAKILHDQAKMEADMAMGTKEKKLKNQINSTSYSNLRKLNGGTLDVIDPNYRINSGSILSTYIMNFTSNKVAWS